jgi:ABC-type phosphate transport system permease subunit
MANYRNGTTYRHKLTKDNKQDDDNDVIIIIAIIVIIMIIIIIIIIIIVHVHAMKHFQEKRYSSTHS